VGVGRGAAVAVAAGLVLVALVGAAAMLRTPDSGTGGRPVADGSSVGPRHAVTDPAPSGGSTPPAPRHGASPPASPSVSPSATPSATSTSPTLPSSTLPSVEASVTSVPTPTKHHGKPPKADHTPGHGVTHGPWKP
jgi:hypothetical protein